MIKRILKRIAIVILSLITLLVFIYGIGIELIPRVHSKAQVVTTEESKTWMKSIDDERLLSTVTIPGIHDAGAQNLKLAAFGKCQDESIFTLLEEGYRYIDLRLGFDGENFYLYHGFLNCQTGNQYFGKNMLFQDVLSDMLKFLEENPSETILLVVKQERKNQPVSEFEAALQECIAKNSESKNRLYTSSIPTMGEARGKIVFCRRYADEANLGALSGLPILWEDQRNKEPSECPYVETQKEGITTYVQDRFKYKVEDKWIAFTKTQEEASSLTKTGIVINFLSTNGNVTFGFPHVYAKKLNQEFISTYKNQKLSGWIIVDFGNSSLAEVIYKSNV